MSGNDGSTPPLETIEAVLRDGSFEDALRSLESVVEHLERGQLSIADAVSWYEAGLALTRRCATLLEEAELRISTLDEAYTLASGSDAHWDANEP
jgi:exodeoxyribonuclease VII small subunit